jgi:hypothetical protein
VFSCVRFGERDYAMTAAQRGNGFGRARGRPGELLVVRTVEVDAGNRHFFGDRTRKGTLSGREGRYRIWRTGAEAVATEGG